MTKSPHTVAVESLCDSSEDNERTQNILVHLTDTDADEQLVREARAYAAGIGGQLVLLSVMTSREFEERRRAYTQIRDLPRYTLPMAIEKHRQSAERNGRSVLNSLDIEYTAVGLLAANPSRCSLPRRHTTADTFSSWTGRDHCFVVSQATVCGQSLADSMVPSLRYRIRTIYD
jgi:hypothetical protein